MFLAFTPTRCLFLGRNVLHLSNHHYGLTTNRYHHRNHPRHLCMCTSPQAEKQPAAFTSRERRRAAGRARLAQNINVKKDLETNRHNVVPTIVMVPSFVRERCNLTARMSRVKLFIERSDVINNDISIFRDRIRSALVQFFPELEERHLLRPADGFDLRLSGAIIPTSTDPNADINNNTNVVAQGLQRSEDVGSPLYIEIIPHNTPPPKLPLSQRVDRVKEEAQQSVQQNGKLYMISFYKFVQVRQPPVVSSKLMKTWLWMGIKGRVYVATEGINAQLAVPEILLSDFKDAMNGTWVERGEPVVPKEFHSVFLNVDRIVDSDAQPFEKLHVRPRDKILSDGLDNPLDWNRAGRELDPDEWHRLLLSKKQQKRPNKKKDDDDFVVLDCRNGYESDVGRFDGAQALNTTTFRDTWEKLAGLLKNEPRDKPILTYCTGGIRCVKVNAFLEQEMGFTNTGRLSGGIVSYTRKLREKKLPSDEDDEKNHVAEKSLFKGVNHVFDGRMGEVITEDLLDQCINCGQACNVQTDCANVSCPRPFDRRIFVQCEECTARMSGACSHECEQYISSLSSFQNTVDMLSTPTSNTTALDEQISVLQQPDRTEGETVVTNIVTAKVRESNENELYADTFSMDEEPLLTKVRRKTEEAFPNRMHVMSSHSQALFLKMLVQISGAKRVLEIGTFTGYATLYMASGMTKGEVVTCEKDDFAANIAQECFVQRTEQEREMVPIHLLRGDADKTIRELLKMSPSNDNRFEMAFVDADKGGYIRYLKMLLDEDLITIGGLVVIDNVLFRGEVASIWKNENQVRTTPKDEEIARKRLRNLRNVRKTAGKLHDFNQYLKYEKRLEQVILPFRDGLTIGRRTS